MAFIASKSFAVFFLVLQMSQSECEALIAHKIPLLFYHHVYTLGGLIFAFFLWQCSFFMYSTVNSHLSSREFLKPKFRAGTTYESVLYDQSIFVVFEYNL